jgi:hypothetical protein
VQVLHLYFAALTWNITLASKFHRTMVCARERDLRVVISTVIWA